MPAPSVVLDMHGGRAYVPPMAITPNTEGREMTKNTAHRIACLMDNARAAGFIVTTGRDDEYGREWWDILDHDCPDLTSLHILIMSDADGWCVAGENASGPWRSLAEAEREVQRWVAA